MPYSDTPMSFSGKNNGGFDPSDLRDLQEKVSRFLSDFNNKGSFLIYGILFFLGLIATLQSFYTVQPKEEAVVLRLGSYLQTTQPGLHFKLPLGIDQIFKLPTRLVLQEEFGFRTSSTSSHGASSYSKGGFAKESSMLTGDLNVADVEWVVQYRISDPNKFLFNVKDPERNIRDISESVMRRVVGDRLVGDVLTTGRTEIAADAKDLMQEIIDKYDFGIKVVSVKLQDVNPPESVKASFNEVNSAKQEQEETINVAEKDYNRVIPEARGRAEETIAKAEGYAEALVNRANGDAKRFLSVLAEYKRAPAITKKRIYLETMEERFSSFEHLTIVDPAVKGVIPLYRGLSEK